MEPWKGAIPETSRPRSLLNKVAILKKNARARRTSRVASWLTREPFANDILVHGCLVGETICCTLKCVHLSDASKAATGVAGSTNSDDVHALTEAINSGVVPSRGVGLSSKFNRWLMSDVDEAAEYKQCRKAMSPMCVTVFNVCCLGSKSAKAALR